MQTLETRVLPLCLCAPKHKGTSESNSRYISPSYGVCFFPHSNIRVLSLLEMWKLQCPWVEISGRRDTNLVLDNEEDRELWQWHTDILGEIRTKKYLRQTSWGDISFSQHWRRCWQEKMLPYLVTDMLIGQLYVSEAFHKAVTRSWKSLANKGKHRNLALERSNETQHRWDPCSKTQERQSCARTTFEIMAIP